jgi:hypothetical protein
MIYIRSCFSVMTTNLKDRVVRAQSDIKSPFRLSFSLFEITIYLFLVCMLFHACSDSKRISPRLRQISKAGDRTLNILINLQQSIISVMAPKKSGKITRLEPEGTELLEAFPQMEHKFKDAGWFDFFSTFQGHDEQISIIFAHNFDGFETIVGKILMHVTEHPIEKACRLLVYEERWWKKETLVMEFVNHFLIPERQNPNWSQGIPHSWVRKE